MCDPLCMPVQAAEEADVQIARLESELTAERRRRLSEQLRAIVEGVAPRSTLRPARAVPA